MIKFFNSWDKAFHHALYSTRPARIREWGDKGGYAVSWYSCIVVRTAIARYLDVNKN